MWWNCRSFCNKADKSRHFFPVFPPHRKFTLQKANTSGIISICGSLLSPQERKKPFGGHDRWQQKKNDPRREARIAKNNRNLNSALTLFTAGFIAEFYLLLINQYFVKGSVDQVVAIAGYLEVMAIVGAAAFGAGVVLTVMRRKWTRFAAAGKWLLGLGLFFGVSSLLMRRVYPMGTTVMCILVPVLMLLAVVFLLYQHEFAVQAIALTLAIASAVLLNHGSSSMPALVTAFCWAAMVLVAALLVLTVMLQKHEGSKGTVIFPAKTNYALTCAVLVLSIAAIAVSLFAASRTM